MAGINEDYYKIMTIMIKWREGGFCDTVGDGVDFYYQIYRDAIQSTTGRNSGAKECILGATLSFKKP